MTIEQERVIKVEATPDRVWAVYSDVEKWPEWTPTMHRIERLEDGPLALGSTARIEAKGSPKSVWIVTELSEGRSFTWETTARGVRVVAWHYIEADGGGQA